MKKWVMSGAVLLVGAAALAGCGQGTGHAPGSIDKSTPKSLVAKTKLPTMTLRDIRPAMTSIAMQSTTIGWAVQADDPRTPIKSLLDRAQLVVELENVFGRTVDLADKQRLYPLLAPEILATREVMYAATE
ncbi:hypothetical protein [Sulfobacillus harzensis]|uniref:Uncharacterized protein n=1 Tax=Sulfobacillus harzensis TaxID=2729629 RepID=A0A7Y0L677_9FIRM|nr:hypothetical protein [Sulfobacillus harzensis]NMP23190.1 hypothetical protein [Sulfobacillus harzensis]